MDNNYLNRLYRTLSEVSENLDFYSIDSINETYISMLIKILERVREFAKDNQLEEIIALIDNVEIEKLSLSQNFNTLKRSILACKSELGKLVISKKSILVFSTNIEPYTYLKESFQAEGFDIIIKEENLMDNIMEIMPEVIIVDSKKAIDTLSIIRNIKEDGSIAFIPIVAIGPEDEELKIKLLAQGVIDYLYTSFNPLELIYKVRNLCNLSHDVMKNQVKDWLTDTYTKRHGKEASVKEFGRIKEKGGNLSLLLIDMDNMAEINLNKGYDTGSKIIKDSADIFKKFLSYEDIIYRTHGDGFVILFTGRDALEVIGMANKMQEEIMSLSNKYNFDISFSGGIGVYSKDLESYDKLYNIAYDSLQKAKRSGKKKIHMNELQLENFKRHKIVFLDDDKIILSILGSRYKNKGYEVYTMKDPYEALDFIKENSIDLVVTDFYMPNMQGDTFIKEIRKFNNAIKIVVLSGQKGEELMERVWKLGADDYLSKPFSPVELDLRIKKLLSTR